MSSRVRLDDFFQVGFIQDFFFKWVNTLEAPIRSAHHVYYPISQLSLSADPAIASSISAHTLVVIDHEIISKTVLFFLLI